MLAWTQMWASVSETPSPGGWSSGGSYLVEREMTVMANSSLDVDCESSSVQRISHVLSHVPHTQKAQGTHIVVRPALQMRGLK